MSVQETKVAKKSAATSAKTAAKKPVATKPASLVASATCAFAHVLRWRKPQMENPDPGQQRFDAAHGESVR